jgi:hypothetical protein
LFKPDEVKEWRADRAKYPEIATPPQAVKLYRLRRRSWATASTSTRVDSLMSTSRYGNFLSRHDRVP